MSSPPWYKLIFVLFLIFVFFLFTGIIGLLVVMMSYNLSLTEVMAVLDNPEASNVAALKLLQIIQTIGLFVCPSFIASFFFGSGVISYLKMDTRPSFFSVVLVVFIMVIWIPAVNYIAGLNSRLDLPQSLNKLEEEIGALRDNYGRLTNLFLDTKSVSDFIVNIIVMAVLPAVGEELLFRGIFQRLFITWTRNIHWGIIISSLLFSFFHFEFYGFLPRLLLGMLFGYLFVWTTSIWIPMLAHFTNNIIIVGYYFFRHPVNDASGLDELGTNADIWLWLSLAGGIMLSYLLFYHEKSRRLSVS